jgi:hypothetical protein
MTNSSNELKKIRWGFVALAFLAGGYGLFTGFLLSGLGHLPGTKWEFILAGVLLYSVTVTLWSLNLARRTHPGLLTYTVGLAGMLTMFYGLYFFA